MDISLFLRGAPFQIPWIPYTMEKSDFTATTMTRIHSAFKILNVEPIRLKKILPEVDIEKIAETPDNQGLKTKT